MSYIVAIPCKTGIVMCADTQETINEQKQYSEKLSTVDGYPLAIGGAGVDEIIEAFQQELSDRVTESRPETNKELAAIIKAAILKVYEQDVPISVIPRQYRTQQFLIAAKPPNDDFSIFSLTGKRLYRCPKCAIIGFATAPNNVLLERLYRDGLSMQQAVMMAVFLVSQSKKLDEGVGGETRVAYVVENGARIDDHEYISLAERRIRDFMSLTDALFLDSIDISVAPSKFQGVLSKFGESVTSIRQSFMEESAAISLAKIKDQGYVGDGYAKLFPGVVVGLGRELTVREESEHDRKERLEREEAIRELQATMELAAKNPDNEKAAQELAELLRGREILYVGQDVYHGPSD